ncbi:MAG TPA: histidine kinase [Thermoanaerobaculia bacterium]|jgi:MFS family permease
MLRRIVILVAFSALSCADLRDMRDRFGGETRSIDSGRVLRGDHPRAADPLLDDSAWPRELLWNVTREPLWIRMPIHLDTADTQRQLGVYVGALASHEVWWDGRRIGVSGTAESAGPIDNFYPLDARTAGEHLLAIRILPGPADASRGFFQGIAIGDYPHLVRSRIAAQLVPLAALGVFIVVGLYYLSLWLAASRRPSVLVFALLCFAASLLVTAETWRWIAGYTWDWHLARIQIILVLTAAIAFLLPLFFVLELGLRRPRIWAGATAVALLFIAARNTSFDERSLQLLAIATTVSAAAILVALPRRKWEALPSAIGIAILGAALIAGGYGFSDSSFFLAFAALIVCLLVSLAVQMRRQRREHESALLRAARLEIELLKKSIQPHFIMNTLMAVMEWIEEDPREGVRFLDALADELRIFAEVSGEKLIAAGRELELCRSHLAIMSARKGTRFALDAEGVDSAAPLPPAIFHTLIENAITHNSYDESEVVFTLREERTGDTRRYVMDAPIRNAARTATGHGLGLRYVKARLEESFPGRWSVESAPFAECWRTTIEVRG